MDYSEISTVDLIEIARKQAGEGDLDERILQELTTRYVYRDCPSEDTAVIRESYSIFSRYFNRNTMPPGTIHLPGTKPGPVPAYYKRLKAASAKARIANVNNGEAEICRRTFGYDVFISYSTVDEVRVHRIAERLRQAGLKVWLDHWIIKPGDDIYLCIERGQEASRTMLLCMSKNAFGSDWTTLERSTAIFRDPANTSRRFVPLLLADCTIPDTLRRLRYVDFRDDSYTEFEMFVASLRGRDS